MGELPRGSFVQRGMRRPSIAGLGAWLLVVAACRASAPAAPVSEAAPVSAAPVSEAEPERPPARHEGSDAIDLDGSPCEEPSAVLSTDRSSVLRLSRVDVDAVVEGPLSRTTLTLAITNLEGPRLAEARLRLRLPEAAVFRDLRLEVGGQWQRSGVVPRSKGQEVYDRIVQTARDPALVEQEDPRTISLRVFPIVLDSAAKVELTWVQPMLGPTQDQLEVPLCGLPWIGQLYARVEERGGGSTRVDEARLHSVTPEASLRARLHGGRPAAIRDGRWVAAAVEPAETSPAPLSGLTILVDTSASSRASLGSLIDRLEQVLAELAEREPSLPVQVLAFDQTVERIGSGRIDAVGDLLVALRRRGALGGTDVLGGLEGALALGVHPRVLVVTDGVATLATEEAPEGPALTRRLRRAGVQRIDLVSSRPPWWLRHLARHGPTAGRVFRDDVTAERLGQGLRQRPLLVEVEQPGVELVAAGEHGDEAESTLLLAQLGAEQAWPPKLTGARVPAGPPAAATVEGLVAPLFADAVLGTLERERRWRGPDDPRHDARIEREAALALEHGLLTEYTALLALESDQSWVDWGLESYRPKRVSDIEEMKSLEPMAARLEALERAQRAIEREYLLALEAWVLAKRAGEDPGPRPIREDFPLQGSAERRAQLLQRRHEAPARPTPFAEIERALAAGDHAAAWARVEAWRADAPDDPLVELAGGRVAWAGGDASTAARWLGSTFERPPSDPAFGTGLFFVPPAGLGAERLEPMLRRHAERSAEQAGVRRGIEALARGEPVTAIRVFARTRTRREDAEVDALLWLTASVLDPRQRRRVASLLGDHPKPSSFVPRRMIVVMANEMAGEQLLLAFEDREGVVVSSSNDARFRLPGGNLGTILVVSEPARSDRILLRGAPEGDAPVVGVAYLLEPAGGRIRVTHHPFAFDGVERTITLD